MSKPDPAITANLLNTVLGKPEAHGPEGAPKASAKPVHAHGTEGPMPKAAKPKTQKNSTAGAAHMRSSNRGK